MKVAVKSYGDEIKYIDVQDLPVTKELVKFKKETQELIKSLEDNLVETNKELAKAKLENVEIVRRLLER